MADAAMTGPRSRELAALDPWPKSDRIELRVPDERDVDLILAASADPLIPLLTTVVAGGGVEQAHEFIERQQHRPVEGMGWSMTIVDRELDEPVGNLFLHARSVPVRGLELGYWVASNRRGRAYASQAVELMRDWAPEALGIDRITLYIDPENTPSLRTAERAGFHKDAMHDRWELVDDEFRPMTVWGHGTGRRQPTDIVRLEHRMWATEYRGDPRWFDHHLHDDFVEHGCSGQLWTRERITTTPVTEEIEVQVPLHDPHVEQIDDTTWMMTYIAVQLHRSCRRASIWQETADGWRMRFHQGTVIEPHEVSGGG